MTPAQECAIVRRLSRVLTTQRDLDAVVFGIGHDAYAKNRAAWWKASAEEGLLMDQVTIKHGTKERNRIWLQVISSVYA